MYAPQIIIRVSFEQRFSWVWKFNGMLIDPYNSLTKDNGLLKGLGGHEYDYLATTEIRMFCKKNKVSVWLNTHAATNSLE